MTTIHPDRKRAHLYLAGHRLLRIALAGLASVALLAVSGGSAAFAQDDDITIKKPGRQRIRIAVPFPRVGGEAQEIVDEIVATVRDDLGFDGRFDVLGQEIHDLVKPAGGGFAELTDWLSVGAEAVVRLEPTYDPATREITVKGYLFDTESEQRLFAYRYNGKNDRRRRVAHWITDDIVRLYTGGASIARTWITFSSKHGEGKEIYIMDYDGKRVRRLTTTDTINITPAWSPIENTLAFLSWRDKQPSVFLLDGTGKLTKAPALATELSAAPEWNPEGDEIVYAADASGGSDLYSLDLSTGRNTRLTRSRSIETAPAYSPTGREIAFTSDRSGSPQIYLMSAEGLNVRRLTFEGSYSDSAAWSPDGNGIVYVSRRNGRFDLMLYDVENGTHRALTRGEGNNENPRWSPDSRHIVFASDRYGTYDIFTLRLEDGRITRLTRGGDCYTPDWSRWSE